MRCDEQGELDHHLRPFADLTDRIIETTPRIGRKKRFKKAARFTEKGQVGFQVEIISEDPLLMKWLFLLALWYSLVLFNAFRAKKLTHSF